MPDWQEIDLDGARIDGLVTMQSGVLAWGERNGRPFAAEVAPDGAVRPAELPGSGAVTSATFNERYELVVGTPPQHLEGGLPGSEWGVPDHFAVADHTVVEDPARLWLSCGDEDPMLVAADADGQLVAVDPGIGIAGEPSGLFLAADASLLVAGGEIGVRVAGVLRTGGLTEPQRWSCFSVEDRWQRLSLHPVPDAFTDLLESWQPVTAGHRDHRPLVWDDDGRALSVPDLWLDESWPVVSVAAGPPVLTLALQSEEGPVLCTEAIDGWSTVALPPGHLVVARRDLGDSERVWVVVNGDLWAVAG